MERIITSSVLDPEEVRVLAGEYQEAVVLMHRTAVPRAKGDWGFEASAVLERAGVREGKWFVLGADGSYDVHLNRFGRELDSWGVRSDNGHEGYMRDVMLYCRFLHESRGGKSIWETDSDDLKAYKSVRLRKKDREALPRLQVVALTDYAAELDELLADIETGSLQEGR